MDNKVEGLCTSNCDEPESARPAPLSYDPSPGKRDWPAVAGAIIGILLASALFLFGLLGVWALIADLMNPHKDRSLVFNFILMVGFGMGVGSLIMLRCIRALRKPAPDRVAQTRPRL